MQCPLGNGYLRRSTAVNALTEDWEDLRAVCWRHDGCTLSRGCGPDAKHPAYGRPAGTLWRFLQVAHLFIDKYSHKEAMAEWAQWDLRKAARDELKGMVDWNINWQVAERPKRLDEPDEEPEGIPGGLTPEARALQRLLAS